MKDHAKTVHKTTEARALGQISVLEMMSKKINAAPKIDIVTDFNQNIVIENDVDDNIPAPKVRIVCRDEIDTENRKNVFWKKEEKEQILNELKSLSSKMDKIEINLNEKVEDETATNPVEVINLDFFMKNSRTLTELLLRLKYSNYH